MVLSQKDASLSTYQRGLLFAFTTALSWSVLAIALKFALNYADSETIAWFRMSVASLALIAFFGIRNRSRFEILKTLPLLGVIAGVCLAANYVGYMQGIHLTSASHAQIMIQMAPLSLGLVGIFYFKETPNLPQAIGFLLAILGFSLFYWDQWNLSPSGSEQIIMGTLWIVFAAVTWVFFASFQKVLSRRWSPQEINLLIYITSTLVLFPLADTSKLSEWSFGIWILMIACGLNTVLAYGCLGEALKRIPASHISLIISANPLITLFLIYLLTAAQVSWLKPEPVSLKGYLGAVCVVSGLILTLRKKPQKSQD